MLQQKTSRTSPAAVRKRSTVAASGVSRTAATSVPFSGAVIENVSHKSSDWGGMARELADRLLRNHPSDRLPQPMVSPDGCGAGGCGVGDTGGEGKVGDVRDERHDLSQPLLPTKQTASIALAASPTRILLLT